MLQSIKSKLFEWSRHPYARFLALFLLFMALYCLQRFSLEFVRVDYVPVVGPFSVTHIACFVAVSVSTYLMLRGLGCTAPVCRGATL